MNTLKLCHQIGKHGKADNTVSTMVKTGTSASSVV